MALFLLFVGLFSGRGNRNEGARSSSFKLRFRERLDAELTINSNTHVAVTCRHRVAARGYGQLPVDCLSVVLEPPCSPLSN